MAMVGRGDPWSWPLEKTQQRLGIAMAYDGYGETHRFSYTDIAS